MSSSRTAARPVPIPVGSATPPATLLSVLPMSTALAGGAAVVLVPTVWTIVGAIATRSAASLMFVAVMFPGMLVGAIATALFGAAAGALAGLPDRLLRGRRAPRLLGPVAAVVILTALVTTAWALVTAWWDDSGPLPTGVHIAAVSVTTAALTTLVVARAKRRTSRRTRQRTRRRGVSR
ncbi:hypothetical protein ACPEEZ_06170 [Frigoribacterium sp. 2-23]|uniref:hypothetical protein n=1 Tax=Frigoribacterium sp. 2-23 TaxID=3415006 RepID=UPI003C6EE71F